ncbi:protein MEI2-like 1 isoform X1 [Pyrus x bretschneideri]|uniref:protein MEI2-like 1 isoform X1 n=1 Tax=Pyrus x bretschneideri TaxID=225117 RepID=UPI00202F0DDA|nr:protein MEI2-like 1 isoform X1 [Pyrus x bretschneideri]XP_009373641.2 protein MEI2-like 1 isoform X1 [Pyrus x bretschneideri]
MPFEIMDQRGVSVSSHFFEEIPFPSERQVGYQKLKTMPDYQAGVSGMVPTPGSTLGSSMPSKMYLPNGAPSVDYLDPPQSNLAGEQTERLSVVEGIPNISKASWKPMDHQPKLWSDLSAKPTPYSSVGGKTLIPGAQHESSLFSSSLSETFSKKLRLLKNDFISHQSTDNVAFQHEEEPFESLEEIEAQTIGNLLPDDNDLFSGMTDEPGYKAYANIGDGFEDFDLFSSSGGLEMEGDDQGVYNSSIAGEHPYGEHPSRTLFVRNINSNIEDLELKALFEQYGDIRALYTACKHRGFVMISYYDIRAAQNALRALQSKALRHRKLDIHYSIPKDNPSDKDINQGTLVLFNLDSSVSSDELSKIFGSYGEIKEIRETPHKPHNKFIEFYDVRAAEAALHALNRSEIGGKQIKLEPSRPGGIRRGLAQVSERDRDEFKFCNGLSDNLSTGTKATLHPGMVTSSCMVNGSSLGLHSAVRSPVSAFIENALSHQSSSVPDVFPTPATLASIGKKFSLRDTERSLDDMNFGNQSAPGIHPHSLPEYNDSLAHGIPCNTSGAIGIINGNLGLRMREGTDRRSTVSANGHLVEPNGGAFGSPGNGSCPVHAHPYLWNNSNSYQQHPSSPMMWQNSPSFISGHSAHHFPQMPGFHGTPPHMLSGTSPVHLHVGSAPAVNPSIWEKHAFSGESPDTSNLHLGSLGFPRFAGSPQMHPMEISSQNLFSLTGGNFLDMTTSTRQRSSQEMGHMFPGRNSMSSMPTSFDSQNERGVRNLSHRRNEANPNNADKRQYELDVERILRGEDRRTTLMIKNIPNKYTSKMLLAAIDEQCRGIYDFLYLPIDFKNKCNVGYAFINMIDPHQIVPFYKAFNGKKWEKFNSEKVASLAYARIQGKAALIAHFQNSSLMNEDKRCRPILFHTEGPNAGDPEPFPMGTNIRSRPGKPRTAGYDDNHNHGSPSATVNGEENSKESDRDLFYQDF